MNPDHMRMEPKAVQFVKAFFDAGKPVAAICHAPWMIAEAGHASGMRMTSWPSLRTDLQNAGAEWIDDGMVRDDNLVTSRKPDDIPAFNRGMIELFHEKGGIAPRGIARGATRSTGHSKASRGLHYPAWGLCLNRLRTPQAGAAEKHCQQPEREPYLSFIDGLQVFQGLP